MLIIGEAVCSMHIGYLYIKIHNLRSLLIRTSSVFISPICSCNVTTIDETGTFPRISIFEYTVLTWNQGEQFFGSTTSAT